MRRAAQSISKEEAQQFIDVLDREYCDSEHGKPEGGESGCKSVDLVKSLLQDRMEGGEPSGRHLIPKTLTIVPTKLQPEVPSMAIPKPEPRVVSHAEPVSQIDSQVTPIAKALSRTFPLLSLIHYQCLIKGAISFILWSCSASPHLPHAIPNTDTNPSFVLPLRMYKFSQ